MVKRSIVLGLVIMIFVFLLSEICWAEDKLINITSTDEAINKFFTGRILDPVEGIWVLNEGCEIVIVKASLINIQNPKYQNCDYFGLYTKGKFAGVMYVGLKKTQ